MAKDQTRPLDASTLADDEAGFNALQQITGYAPANSDISLASLTTLNNEKHAAQVHENQLTAAAATARDERIRIQWEFHNQMLRVKDQITAQYGKDSNEAQEVGLKKTTEYKRRSRKPAAPPKP